MRQRPPSEPRPKDPLEAARESLNDLRDADDWDEPTGRVLVNVHPPPPAPAAKLASLPLPAAIERSQLQAVVSVFHHFPKWGAVLVALALIAAWAYVYVHRR